MPEMLKLTFGQLHEKTAKNSSNTFFISPYPLELTFLLAFKNLLKLILTTTTL